MTMMGRKADDLQITLTMGVDHENQLTESKFAEEIILGAFTKMYH